MSEVGKVVEEIAGPKSVSDRRPSQSSGSSLTGAAVAAAESPKTPIGRYRWVICALLFFATTINYIDRQVLGILGPELSEAIGWTAKDYTDIVFGFRPLTRSACSSPAT